MGGAENKLAGLVNEAEKEGSCVGGNIVGKSMDICCWEKKGSTACIGTKVDGGASDKACISSPMFDRGVEYGAGWLCVSG